MQPEITANYVDAEKIGYGRMGVNQVAQLRELGVDVVKGQEKRDTNVVMWFSVPSHAHYWKQGQYRVAETMWESQRLAEGMREGLGNFDLIIVPCEQNLELFSNYHDNVKKVPLGISQEWDYRERVAPDQWFNFLIGGSGPRKGTDLAVKAFQRVFGDFRGSGPIPRLILKNPKGEGLVGERIEMIAGHITAQEELDLYATAHCYLQPSRGEGFGLQPLQAIAQGCPTILTNAHGHAEFAHLGYGIGWSSTPADYFSFGYAGEWWEPDFDELCERMEWVYDNWTEAAAFAKTSSETARLDFTWANSAWQLLNAIGLDQLTTPYSGNGERVAAKIDKYKVIVNKRWKANIAGIDYSFEPGREYYEPADVLRIMFDAGLLDPVCLEGSSRGLNEDQLAHLGAYSASHSHCEACGALANSTATYQQYLMAKGEVERLTRELDELRGSIEGADRRAA